MRLAQILERGRIVHRLASTAKDTVLEEIVLRGFSGIGIDHARVTDLLRERERLTSTGLNAGLAIPHAKLEHLDSVIAAVGVSDTGVAFGAPDGVPSRVFIVLLAPEAKSALHLQALARVARLFVEPKLVQRVVDAEDSDAVLRVLLDEDSRYN